MPRLGPRAGCSPSCAAPDRAAARRVDAYVANSAYTAERIREAYDRDATVVYPPVDTAAFAPDPERSGRFLVVARLRRHKRIDLAIEAATRHGWPLDVIGEGPDEAALRRAAGPSVRFHGRLPDEAVARAMARCIALIVPGTEDFGMTMAEVQAAGRPPVAFARGGALEIVRDGETGFTFDEPTAESLAAAMRRSMADELDPRRPGRLGAALRSGAVRRRDAGVLATRPRPPGLDRPRERRGCVPSPARGPSAWRRSRSRCVIVLSPLAARFDLLARPEPGRRARLHGPPAAVDLRGDDRDDRPVAPGRRASAPAAALRACLHLDPGRRAAGDRRAGHGRARSTRSWRPSTRPSWRSRSASAGTS